MSIERRKKNHIEICVERDVETPTTGFEDIFLVNNSLPELDLDLDVSGRAVGKHRPEGCSVPEFAERDNPMAGRGVFAERLNLLHVELGNTEFERFHFHQIDDRQRPPAPLVELFNLAVVEAF